MPYKHGLRDQVYLLPPAVDDWVAADHPVRFVWAFVEELDLTELGIETHPTVLGASAYPPRELLACWLYGFMDGRRSSRALECACRETLPYLWLMGLLRPDHVTLWRFYRANREAMRSLFKQTVRVAVEVGLVDFALQAIDGSKVPVASAYSLQKKSTLEKLLAKLDAEIAKMEASEAQEVSDPPYDGDGRRLAKKEEQRQRVRRALASIAAEEATEGERDKTDTPEEGEGSASTEKDKEPVACSTDPEASLMKTRHGWKIGYNAQIVVDSKKQIIIVADVTDENYDQHQLIPLLKEEQETLGCYGQVTLADNGYFSRDNVAYAQERTDLYVPDKSYESALTKETAPYHHSKFTYDAERDLYICPEGQELPFVRLSKGNNGCVRRQYQCRTCQGCAQREACTRSRVGRTITRTEQDDMMQAYRQKTMTKEAKDLIKRRPPLVEAVFGILKERHGGRRFLRRGLENVKSEWYLLCSALNLRKMCQAWQDQCMAPGSLGA